MNHCRWSPKPPRHTECFVSSVWVVCRRRKVVLRRLDPNETSHSVPRVFWVVVSFVPFFSMLLKQEKSIQMPKFLCLENGNWFLDYFLLCKLQTDGWIILKAKLHDVLLIPSSFFLFSCECDVIQFYYYLFFSNVICSCLFFSLLCVSVMWRAIKRRTQEVRG